MENHNAGTRDPSARHSFTTFLDLALVGALTLLFYVFATRLEFAEKLLTWLSAYEILQLDELPATLLVFTTAMLWFAWRRWREAHAESIAREKAERAHLLALQENQRLSRELLFRQDEERQSLARDLHDEFGQHCAAISVEAASIRDDTRDALPVTYASAVAITRSVEALQGMIRRMLESLHPAPEPDIGLETSVEALVDTWSQCHQIRCALRVAESLPHLPVRGVGTTAYRIVQESLTNVARHAQATGVEVALSIDAASGASLDYLLIVVDDNGMGYPENCTAFGYGLQGMRERAAACGGEVLFMASPGRGARVAARLPLTEDR